MIRQMEKGQRHDFRFWLGPFREEPLRRDRRVRLWAIGGTGALILAFVLLSHFLVAPVDLEVGDLAPHNIKAPRTIVDWPTTERLQTEAAQRAVREAAADPENYVISQPVIVEAEAKLETIFMNLRQYQDKLVVTVGANPTPAQVEAEARQLQRHFQEQQGVEIGLPALNWALTSKAATLTDLEEKAHQILVNILRRTRIDAAKLDAAREQVDLRVQELNLAAGAKRLLLETVRGLIVPNLMLDPQKIEAARQEAMRNVKPAMILKDEVIVREGEKVTPEQIRILQDLGMQRQQMNYFAIMGVSLLTLILASLLGLYLYQYRPDILLNESRLALFTILVAGVALLAKVLSLIPWQGTVYLIPVAFGTMLIALLLDMRLAMLAGVVLAAISAVLADNNLGVFLTMLTGGMVGVFAVVKVGQRSDLTRAGFFVSIASLLTIAGFGLATGEMQVVKLAAVGLLNGVSSSILTIGTLPYLETLFGLTSAIRLLELSNPNQPLLRQLLVEAPGTYHHSIIVGNLAEAAAERVEADGLLARVGAYYHDIGKLKRPYFFVDNQFAMENPHDKLAPTLSTLIITSHVKDGLELGRKYKLPQSILDMIAQHHGTDLVKYFYHRAVESGTEGIEEKDFRYPGPRPQSKEAAILMLADGVEAAVRSLAKPTPGRIEGLVRKLIKDRLADGQLDESALTLRDLEEISKAFVRVLSGIFHSRVEYPQQLPTGSEGRG